MYRFGLSVYLEAVVANFPHFLQLTFAADLLSLFVLACSKISVCLLISVITNQGYPWHHKRPVHGINQNHLFNTNRLLFLFIIFCTLAGVVGLGVQNVMIHHTASQPLTLGSTSWGGAMYLFNGVANIVTDLFLCLLPIAMMWKVQTCMTKKIQVVLLFGVRIMLVHPFLPYTARFPN